jgi:hypothetical protein
VEEIFKMGTVQTRKAEEIECEQRGCDRAGYRHPCQGREKDSEVLWRLR